MEIAEDRIPMRLAESGLSIADLSSVLEKRHEALYLLEAQRTREREDRTTERISQKTQICTTTEPPAVRQQQTTHQPEHTLTPLFQHPRVDQRPTTSPTPKFDSVDSHHAHDHWQHGRGAEGDGPRGRKMWPWRQNKWCWPNT